MRQTLSETAGARVYVADDRVTGRRVAVKLLPPLHGTTEEFRREAATAARARHASLVELVDVGVLDDGTPWLALELVAGDDLRTRLATHGAMTVPQAVEVGVDLFAALAALHRLGLAHGDVKPENVMLGGRRGRLIDFGRAWLQHRYGDGADVYPGTPPYMHPSLFHGGTPYARTDCFAAWVTLYELVAAARPYGSTLLRQAVDGRLPPPRPLPDPDFHALVCAGLDGRLGDARRSWLALRLFARGRPWVPDRPADETPVDPALNESLWRAALAGRSTALVGEPEGSRRVLESVHRRWEDAGGAVLWGRADWASAADPLSGVLALVANAADTLAGPQLATLAAELGPLAGRLREHVPAARAWLPAEPGAGRLEVALERFLLAAPRPLLVLFEGLDRLDGASRRFLGGMVTAGDLTVLGTAAPGAPHGLSHELGLPEAPEPGAAPGAVSPETEAVLARARVLGRPLDAELARLAGLDPEAVEAAALEAEAAGRARWTGREVVPGPGPSVPPEVARDWYAEAAARVDPAVDPLAVARWARLAGDGARLAGVVDPAVERALPVDPVLALDLLEADPRPPSSAALLRRLEVALRAREMERAAAVLERMRRSAAVDPADLAEAEGEYAFLSGHTRPAIQAFRAAARALGRPVREGLLGLWQDLWSVARFFLGRARPSRPDARLGRVFERLHDAQFHHDHAPMLRVHQLWLEAAPDHPRARAMNVVWHVALGLVERAEALEAALLAEVREHHDPVGTAVVLLHRAIARVWRGQVVEAHQDAAEAADRLLQVGDPYLAGLATSTLGVAAFHLGTVGPLSRACDRLERLARRTGDRRALAWVDGCRAIVRWTVGDLDGALELSRGWAAASAAAEESSEALARRFLGDLLLEAGEVGAAIEAFEASERVARRFHLRTDFTEAVVIGLVLADARARLGGGAGVARLGARTRAMRALLRRSPRWTARARVAEGWQAAARGDRPAAVAAFEAALAEAEARRQVMDAWWALDQRARALGDAEAAAAAVATARHHGLRSGYEAARS